MSGDDSSQGCEYERKDNGPSVNASMLEVVLSATDYVNATHNLSVGMSVHDDIPTYYSPQAVMSALEDHEKAIYYRQDVARRREEGGVVSWREGDAVRCVDMIVAANKGFRAYKPTDEKAMEEYRARLEHSESATSHHPLRSNVDPASVFDSDMPSDLQYRMENADEDDEAIAHKVYEKMKASKMSASECSSASSSSGPSHVQCVLM